MEDENQSKSNYTKDLKVEEREKILNAENKTQNKTANDREDKTFQPDSKEGREVKPKKIPIGGIQMPGFFTRSKSKERCKDTENEQQDDVEGTELLETKEKSDREDSLIGSARIKLPNPFRKSKLLNEVEGDKSAEPKERKRLLDTIRLPLVSVFPRKKRESEQNLGSRSNQAGLASIETLDDDEKSADDKKDDFKEVSLDDKKDFNKGCLADEPTWTQKIKAYRIVISALLVFILLVVVIVITVFSGKTAPKTAPIKDGRFVEAVTSCGPVEGMLDDGAVIFRGIPYARPPIGDLRFRPAQPLDNIEYCWNSTFLAHNATDYCLQIYGNGTTAGSEDCLTLDVVTPFVRYDNPLPVVVLIGSDSFIGGSPGKMRPSARYAKARDILFVRPNFRLGVLGFLALNMLSQRTHPPTSGNYGLSDIILALKWIKLNIVHFGGDPDQVVLFGHRAGATMVTALTMMRNAEKLFDRAWATSGGASFPGKSLAESETENAGYLSNVLCEDAACLLAQNATVLMDSIPDTWRKLQPDLPSIIEEPDKKHDWLVVDGDIIQEHPGRNWAEKMLPVKLVLGTTMHAAASEKLFLKNKDWTKELVAQHINNSRLSNLTHDLLRMYPNTFQGLSAMISDVRTVCPLLVISGQMHNTPFYVVTQTRGEHNIADADSDVDAILGRYEPKTPDQRRYVSALQQLFYYYIWHGEVKGVTHKALIVGQDVMPAANYSHCDFWIAKDIVPRYAQTD